MLKGVDVSNWDDGLDLRKLDIDFAIIKASEATDFKDPLMTRFIRQCKETYMLYALYHFANSNDPVSEAKFFYSRIKPYLGEAIPVLDIEVDVILNWTNYISKFAETFYKLAKVWPWVYTSAGFLPEISECAATAKCPLWVAGYPVQYTTWADEGCPYIPTPFKRLIAWQFTESLQLDGYSGALDGDYAYITRDEWRAYASGGKPSENPRQPMKPLATVAAEVIAGKWGNGVQRRHRLSEAGYNYDAVQEEVNHIFNLAHRTMRGDFGNGAKRKAKLGRYYSPVQYVINNIL